LEGIFGRRCRDCERGPSSRASGTGINNLTAVDEVDDFVVHDEHNGGTGTTDDVGKGTLEEATNTFGGVDLLDAVAHAIVHLLLGGLGGLDLQTTLDSVEGVRDNAGSADGDLGNNELGGNADEADFLLVRVEGLDGVLKTELGTSVHDNTAAGSGDTVVEGQDTVGLDGLDEAVAHTAVLLDLAEIGTEDGTHVDQRIHDGVGGGTGQRTRGDLGGGESSELGLLVALGEQGLEEVLEGQVAGAVGT